jgi:exopolysaccharide biosynthesis polyprenyl glycosylphosphotransferase
MIRLAASSTSTFPAPPTMPSRQACQQAAGDVHVLSEELFRGALIRERKRADRSHQPFLLLLVTSISSVPPDRAIWAIAGDALAAAKREADILGWFEDRNILGVLLPETGSLDAGEKRAIEMRAWRELERRCPRGVASQFSVRMHSHAPVAPDSAQPADPVLAQLNTAPVHRRNYTAMKRTMDVVGSAALLVLFAPLFLLIAALIKVTSRGPVLYRQDRVGQGARLFSILKFRTMALNADHGIHHKFVSQFIHSTAAVQGQQAPFKLKNDPRVTSIGKVLRKTSLDELPQFWNVLRGEMSLVGPRPPIQYEVDQYQPWHRRRVLEAKPGITGLWQVSGRSRTTFDEMVRLDLQYANNPSIWADIRILLATPAAVISGKGAC